jgi:hypothetical protein
MSPKTPEQIEDLKWNWRSDPCWDIADTEGFEEHRAELEAYQGEMEKQWAYERLEQDLAQCRKLGCSPQLLDCINSLEHRISGMNVKIQRLQDTLCQLRRGER